MDTIIKNQRWTAIIILVTAILIAFTINACKHKPKEKPSQIETQIKATNDSLEQLKDSIPDTYTPDQRRKAAEKYESIFKD
jgi:hypothetical protein